MDKDTTLISTFKKLDNYKVKLRKRIESIFNKSCREQGWDKKTVQRMIQEENQEIAFFYDCQNEAIKYMSDKGITVLQEYGVEADDLIAFSIKQLAEQYVHTWIISADKDFNALISDTVSQYSTSQAKTMDLDYLKRELDCDPATFLRALIISGDNIDGIPGYYLVGEPKKATSRSLIYAAVGATYEDIAYWVGKKPKIGKIDQYFLDHPEIYKRNKLLIELHHDVLTTEQKEKIRSKLKECNDT